MQIQHTLKRTSGAAAATDIFALNKYQNKEISPVENTDACTMLSGWDVRD